VLIDGPAPRAHAPFIAPPEPNGSGEADRDCDLTADTQKRPSLVDRILFIALILLAFGLRPPEGVEPTHTWLPLDLLWVGFYLVAFVGVLSERKAVLKLLRGSLPLIVILCLVGLSMLWSNDPLTTARRAIALLGTSMIALHFANRLGFRGFVESLAIAIAGGAVISIPVIALLPSWGLQHNSLGAYEGAWQGIFVEKNQLGQCMALGIVTIASLSGGTRGVRRVLLAAGLILFVGLLAGSQSAGALASVAVFAVAFPFWLWIRSTGSRSKAALAALAIPVIMFGAWASGGADQAFGAVGRDATLTGRTEVWQSALNAIGERPFFGYGYREFWDSSGDARYFITPNVDGWYADMAHNGFIEVALDLGVVGIIALAVFLVVSFVRAWELFWRGRDRLSAWPLFIMVDIMLQNLSDRSFATQDSLYWIIFLAAFWFATADSQRRRESALQEKKRSTLRGTIAGGPLRAVERAL